MAPVRGESRNWVDAEGAEDAVEAVEDTAAAKISKNRNYPPKQGG